MKLATYRDGSRDGQLIVVSRDLKSAHYATGVASTLQQILDDWDFLAPQLQDLYVALNQGRARHAFPFDPARCMAPLPRAYRRVAVEAYRGPLDRIHGSAPAVPPLREARSDALLGPRDDVVVAELASQVDFGAGIAVVTGDLPQGADAGQALEGIRLLLLVNDWSLRALQQAELAASLGLLESRPATAFAAVAVTPDEFGDAWKQGRLQIALHSAVNGRPFGSCDAGAMDWPFGQLLARLCRSAPLRAGTIVGAGVASSAGADGGAPRGSGCIAERRAIELQRDGSASTPWLVYGDQVRLEARTRDGQSPFGAIEQLLMPPP